VSYDLHQGEVLGLVGESGCGKSVSAMSILQLIPSPPGQIESGRILLEGKDLLALPTQAMHRVRGNQISMIFQDPMSCLNPVLSIGQQLGTVFRLHHPGLSRRELRKRSLDILSACEIPSPAHVLRVYPHELSGGMRQRVIIAMALSCRPKVLIADEPTTALDVTIQAQILDLILRLQQEFDMAVLMITHDLGVVAQIAHRVAVMYAGTKVEEAQVDQLFNNPMHPYTKALLRSLPSLEVKAPTLSEIKGIVPSPTLRLPGCTFVDRCPEAEEPCSQSRPPLFEVESGHLAACLKHSGQTLPTDTKDQAPQYKEDPQS
jgi:oligopeptide/dipeptide ABC transporter ATP-binding protein